MIDMDRMNDVIRSLDETSQSLKHFSGMLETVRENNEKLNSAVTDIHSIAESEQSKNRELVQKTDEALRRISTENSEAYAQFRTVLDRKTELLQDEFGKLSETVREQNRADAERVINEIRSGDETLHADILSAQQQISRLQENTEKQGERVINEIRSGDETLHADILSAQQQISRLQENTEKQGERLKKLQILVIALGAACATLSAGGVLLLLLK